jgi:hypothetical protein
LLSEWLQLSLDDLKQQVETFLKEGEVDTYTLFESRRWQGQAFKAELEVYPADASPDGVCEAASSSRPFKVGIFTGPHELEEDVLRLITFSITAVAAQPPACIQGRRNQPPAPDDIEGTMTRQGFSASTWGWPDFFEVGPVDSWGAFEAKLRAAHLVHAGDVLRIKVEITEVL